MKNGEKQGILFGDGNKDKPVLINKSPEIKLISNRKPGEKRPYLVTPKDEDRGSIKYYDLGDVHMMGGLGYKVEPILDPKREIISIDTIPNSIVACEICEDLPKNSIEIMPGTNRVGYENGDFRMICEQHKPKLEEKPAEIKAKAPKKVKQREMTEYTKWINDH